MFLSYFIRFVSVKSAFSAISIPKRMSPHKITSFSRFAFQGARGIALRFPGGFVLLLSSRQSGPAAATQKTLQASAAGRKSAPANGSNYGSGPPAARSNGGSKRPAGPPVH